MFQKMLQGENENFGFPTPKTMGSIQAYKDRVSNISGGYFIKEKLCYLDLTFTTKNLVDVPYLLIRDIPSIIEKKSWDCFNISAETGEVNGYSNFAVYYDTDGLYGVKITAQLSQNKTYRIRCVYPTAEADT